MSCKMQIKVVWIWKISKKLLIALIAKISTSDQPCLNVLDQRWNNIDPRSKLDKMRHCIFNIFQSSYSVIVGRQNNVETTLYNVDATVLQPGLNISKSCIYTNRISHKYGLTDRYVSFILLNAFHDIFAIQLLINY